MLVGLGHGVADRLSSLAKQVPTAALKSSGADAIQVRLAVAAPLADLADARRLVDAYESAPRPESVTARTLRRPKAATLKCRRRTSKAALVPVTVTSSPSFTKPSLVTRARNMANATVALTDTLLALRRRPDNGHTLPRPKTALAALALPLALPRQRALPVQIGRMPTLGRLPPFCLVAAAP